MLACTSEPRPLVTTVARVVKVPFVAVPTVVVVILLVVVVVVVVVLVVVVAVAANSVVLVR